MQRHYWYLRDYPLETLRGMERALEGEINVLLTRRVLMTALTKLVELARTTALLARDGEDEDYRSNAEEFCWRAAYLLQEQGWGLVMCSDNGAFAEVHHDRILNKHTHELVQIVAGAGERGQHVIWNALPDGDKAAMYWRAPVNLDTGEGSAAGPKRSRGPGQQDTAPAAPAQDAVDNRPVQSSRERVVEDQQTRVSVSTRSSPAPASVDGVDVDDLRWAFHSLAAYYGTCGAEIPDPEAMASRAFDYAQKLTAIRGGRK